jgi:hypothetical protein
MRRAFVFAVGLMTLLASTQGCAGAEEPDPGDGRFMPTGDNEVVANKDDDCEKGVCSPKADPAPAPAEQQQQQQPATGEPPACENKSTCAAATDMGSMRGDVEGDTRSRTGKGSAFFSVEVAEAEHGPGASPMKAAITLVAPSKENYDLFVYEDDCGEPIKTSEEGPDTTDRVALEWGETGWHGFANNSDDKRMLRIEVRQKSKTCGGEWTLLVQGNTK